MSDGKYYYNRRGNFCFVGSNVSDSGFTNNNFSGLFVINSLYPIDIGNPAGGISDNESDMDYPTVSNNGVISLL